jgi:hypothetical protein
VCLPLGRDQPANARRVVELGLGCSPSPNSSPAELHAAIDQVLADPAIHSPAQQLSSGSWTRASRAGRPKGRTSKPQALFSRDEVMSISAPWLLAERPPSIRRTSRSLWRSRFHSRSSAGASASSSVRCSVKLGSRTRDDLGTLQERSALPARPHIGGALRPMQVHVPAGRDRRLQTRARFDPSRRDLRQVHAPPNPLTGSGSNAASEPTALGRRGVWKPLSSACRCPG